VLGQAQDADERKQALQAKGIDLDAVPRHVFNLLNIDVKHVWSPGKNRLSVKGRCLWCYWSMGKLGMRLSRLTQ